MQRLYILQAKFNLNRLLIIVEGDNYGRVRGVAYVNILMFGREKIDQITPPQRLELSSQASEKPLMYKYRLLTTVAGVKGVDAVRRKAAGKIAAIVRIIAALHRDFITIVELRRAAHSHDQSLSHF